MFLDIVYLTKQVAMADDSGRQAGALSQGGVEITPQMIEAGVIAYRRSASHDEMSFDEPEDTVTAIILAAISQARRP